MKVLFTCGGTAGHVNPALAVPSGSSQRIADELGIDVETVRNYFGGSHAAKECVGVHFEPGPDGGVVTLDDTTILDVAMRILSEQQQ